MLEKRDLYLVVNISIQMSDPGPNGSCYLILYDKIMMTLRDSIMISRRSVMFYLSKISNFIIQKAVIFSF